MVDKCCSSALYINRVVAHSLIHTPCLWGVRVRANECLYHILGLASQLQNDLRTARWLAELGEAHTGHM